MGRSKDSETIIPERIKAILKKRKITQVQLCEDIRENKDVFNRCLRKAEMPKTILFSTAHKLNISPRYLTGETDKEESYADYEEWFETEQSVKEWIAMLDEEDRLKQSVLEYLSRRRYSIPGTKKEAKIDFENLYYPDEEDLLYRLQKTAWIFAIEHDLFKESEEGE